MDGKADFFANAEFVVIWHLWFL